MFPLPRLSHTRSVEYGEFVRILRSVEWPLARDFYSSMTVILDSDSYSFPLLQPPIQIPAATVSHFNAKKAPKENPGSLKFTE